jgi:hypothetical protein
MCYVCGEQSATYHDVDVPPAWGYDDVRLFSPWTGEDDAGAVRDFVGSYTACVVRVRSDGLVGDAGCRCGCGCGGVVVGCGASRRSGRGVGRCGG